MNRILFVGLCLVGMAVFVFANAADKNVKTQPEIKVAKQDYKHTLN